MRRWLEAFRQLRPAQKRAVQTVAGVAITALMLWVAAFATSPSRGNGSTTPTSAPTISLPSGHTTTSVPGADSNTPTTRPNLSPDAMTDVPVLTKGPASLNLATPMLSMGKQIDRTYTASGPLTDSTTVVVGSSLPYMVIYRSGTSDKRWLTVQSDIVANQPWLVVPDATSFRSTASNGNVIDWAKGDDGVDTAWVRQSGDQVFIVRAAGVDDTSFIELANALRAAPRPLFVDDPSGVLQRLHFSYVTAVEGNDVIDGLTYGSVESGTVYGTTDGPVVVRAAPQQSTDLRYLDVVAEGTVRTTTEGYVTGTLRATHDDFIAWVQGDTRFTITAPAGVFDLEQLARGTVMSQVPSAALSSLPLAMFDASPASLDVSALGATDGYWGFGIVADTVGRTWASVTTCFQNAGTPAATTTTPAAIPSSGTTAPPAFAGCASQVVTMAHLRGTPHRIAVPGATLAVAAVRVVDGVAPTAHLTASSSADRSRMVEVHRLQSGQGAVAVLTMSPGMSIDMRLTP